MFSARLADVVKNEITTKTKYGLWSVTLSNESLFTVSRPRRHGYGGKFKQAIRRRSQGAAKNHILYVKLNSCSLVFNLLHACSAANTLATVPFKLHAML